MLTFVYLVEDEPYTGDVTDYVHALENAIYCDLKVDSRVWVFDSGGNPHSVRPVVETSPYDENAYATLTVTVGDDTASVRIDGAA